MMFILKFNCINIFVTMFNNAIEHSRKRNIRLLTVETLNLFVGNDEVPHI